MNREIKFRAWSESLKQMFYATPYRGYLMSNGSWWELYNGDDVVLASSVYDDELMQYTGLKDKNGVEVYEGDILKENNRTVSVEYWNSQLIVGWYVRDFNTGDTAYMDCLVGYEVIGNTYEHPELLKEREQNES